MRFEANTNQLATVSMSVPVIEISWATLDGGFGDKKTDRQVSARNLCLGLGLLFQLSPQLPVHRIDLLRHGKVAGETPDV